MIREVPLDEVLTIDEQIEVDMSIDEIDQILTDEIIEQAEYYEIVEDEETWVTTVTLFDMDGEELVAVEFDDYDVAVAVMEEIFDLDYDDEDDFWEDEDEVIAEREMFDSEFAKSAVSTLKNMFINGFNIRAGIHAAAQAYERVKDFTTEHWKKFFTKVIDTIVKRSLNSGEYLFFSRSMNQGSVLAYNKERRTINLITTLPKGRSNPKPGTDKVLVESIEYQVIEID